jgi:hypothetical protein
MAFGLSTGARIPFLMSCKALYNDPAFWGPNLVVTPGRPLPENWLSKRPGVKRVSIPFVWGSPGRVEATDLAFLRNSSYGEVEELRIEAISKDEAKWRWCALIKRAPPHANLPITFYRAEGLPGVRDVAPRVRRLRYKGRSDANLACLRGLELTHLRLERADVKTLDGLPMLPLVSLRVSECWDLENLDVLIFMRHLAKLSIYKCRLLQSTSFEALAKLPLVTLRYRDWADRGMDSAQIAVVAVLGPTLRHLDVGNSQFNPEWLLVLRSLRLETLRIACDWESRVQVGALVGMRFCRYNHNHNYAVFGAFLESPVGHASPFGSTRPVSPASPCGLGTRGPPKAALGRLESPEPMETEEPTKAAKPAGSADSLDHPTPQETGESGPGSESGPECKENSADLAYLAHLDLLAVAWTTIMFWTSELCVDRLRRAMYDFLVEELQKNRSVYLVAESFPIEILHELCQKAGGVTAGLLRPWTDTTTFRDRVDAYGQDLTGGFLPLIWPSPTDLRILAISGPKPGSGSGSGSESDSQSESKCKANSANLERLRLVPVAWTTAVIWTPESESYGGERLRKAIYEFVVEELPKNRPVSLETSSFPLGALHALCQRVGGVKAGLLPMGIRTVTFRERVDAYGRDTTGETIPLIWPTQAELRQLVASGGDSPPVIASESGAGPGSGFGAGSAAECKGISADLARLDLERKLVADQALVAAAWTTTMFWTSEAESYGGERLRRTMYDFLVEELRKNRPVSLETGSFPIGTLQALCRKVGGVKAGLLRLETHTTTFRDRVDAHGRGMTNGPLPPIWPTQAELWRLGISMPKPGSEFERKGVPVDCT